MKIAFIGAGAMAREHARAFLDISAVELQGVTSRTHLNASRLAQDFSMPIVANSPGELYEATKADIVIIAVTDDHATQVGLEALKYPWTILIEKPPGLDCSETQLLLANTKDRTHPFYVGLNRRHMGSSIEVSRGLAKSPGTRHILVQDAQDLEVAASFGYSQRIIDQWMFANSIHLVDYISNFTRGDLTELKVIQPWAPASPGVISAFLRFDSGDTALYEAQWNRPGPWAISITTPNDRWELRPLEHGKHQRKGSREWNDLLSHTVDSNFKPGFKEQALQIIEGASNRPSTAVTLAESLKSMELIDKIYFP